MPLRAFHKSNEYPLAKFGFDKPRTSPATFGSQLLQITYFDHILNVLYEPSSLRSCLQLAVHRVSERRRSRRTDLDSELSGSCRADYKLILEI